MNLFFLHGVGGGHAAWDDQVAYFGARGHRCIAWDQPGYGATPAPTPYTLDTVTKALRRQIGDQPVVLVGHSMGGLVAQEAYARFPGLIRAMALCFTSAAFVGGSKFAEQFIAARIGPLDEGRTMADVAAAVMPAMRGTRSDPKGQARAERIMAALPPDTYRKAVQLLTTFDRRADLARIAVPTLLVAGSDDHTAPPSIMESMARKIPRAEYRLLEGCGHLGPMDQPEAFNTVLQAFLEKL